MDIVVADYTKRQGMIHSNTTLAFRSLVRSPKEMASYQITSSPSVQSIEAKDVSLTLPPDRKVNIRRAHSPHQMK